MEITKLEYIMFLSEKVSPYLTIRLDLGRVPTAILFRKISVL